MFGRIAGAGAVCALAFPAAALADPPATTATLSSQPNAAGWHSGDVTVSLHASDPDGIEKIVTTLVRDGVQSDEETAGADATRTITAEGATTVNYRARDRAGEEETFKTVVVRIDRTAPSIVIDAPAQGSRVVQGTVITLSWRCEDPVSGLDTCAGPESDDRSRVVDTAKPGSRTLRISSRDRAGHVTVVERTWSVVPKPPDPSGGDPPGFGDIVVLPAHRRCLRGTLVLRLNSGRGVRRVTIYVAGRRFGVLRGDAVDDRVHITIARGRRATVRVVIRMTDGRRYTGTRRYRRCR